MVLVIAAFVLGALFGAALLTGYALIVAGADLERMHRD